MSSPFCGLKVCFTSLDHDTAKRLHHELREAGATVTEAFTRCCDLLIAGSVRSQKYAVALHEKVPVVSPNWVFDSIQEGRLLLVQEQNDRKDVFMSTENNEQEEERRLSVPPSYQLPPMKGLVFCSTGLTSEKQGELATLIERNGGIFQKVLNHEVTHLITAETVSPLEARLKNKEEGEEDLNKNISKKVLFAEANDIPIVLPSFVDAIGSGVWSVPHAELKFNAVENKPQLRSRILSPEVCSIHSPTATCSPPADPFLDVIHHGHHGDCNEERLLKEEEYPNIDDLFPVADNIVGVDREQQQQQEIVQKDEGLVNTQHSFSSSSQKENEGVVGKLKRAATHGTRTGGRGRGRGSHSQESHSQRSASVDKQKGESNLQTAATTTTTTTQLVADLADGLRPYIFIIGCPSEILAPLRTVIAYLGFFRLPVMCDLVTHIIVGALTTNAELTGLREALSARTDAVVPIICSPEWLLGLHSAVRTLYTNHEEVDASNSAGKSVQNKGKNKQNQQQYSKESLAVAAVRRCSLYPCARFTSFELEHQTQQKRPPVPAAPNETAISSTTTTTTAPHHTTQKHGHQPQEPTTGTDEGTRREERGENESREKKKEVEEKEPLVPQGTTEESGTLKKAHCSSGSTLLRTVAKELNLSKARKLFEGKSFYVDTTYLDEVRECLKYILHNTGAILIKSFEEITAEPQPLHKDEKDAEYSRIPNNNDNDGSKIAREIVNNKVYWCVPHSTERRWVDSTTVAAAPSSLKVHHQAMVGREEEIELVTYDWVYACAHRAELFPPSECFMFAKPVKVKVLRMEGISKMQNLMIPPSPYLIEKRYVKKQATGIHVVFAGEEELLRHFRPYSRCVVMLQGKVDRSFNVDMTTHVVTSRLFMQQAVSESSKMGIEGPGREGLEEKEKEAPQQDVSPSRATKVAEAVRSAIHYAKKGSNVEIVSIDWLIDSAQCGYFVHEATYSLLASLVERERTPPPSAFAPAGMMPETPSRRNLRTLRGCSQGVPSFPHLTGSKEVGPTSRGADYEKAEKDGPVNPPVAATNTYITGKDSSTSVQAKLKEAFATIQALDTKAGMEEDPQIQRQLSPVQNCGGRGGGEMAFPVEAAMGLPSPSTRPNKTSHSSCVGSKAAGVDTAAVGGSNVIRIYVTTNISGATSLVEQLEALSKISSVEEGKGLLSPSSRCLPVLSESVTEADVVVVGEFNNRESIMIALASGKWIVRPEYLSACVQDKQAVSPKEYEWTVASAGESGNGTALKENVKQLVSAASYWRRCAEMGGDKPFADHVIFFWGVTNAASLMRIVKAGGGGVYQPALDNTSRHTNAGANNGELCAVEVFHTAVVEHLDITHILVSKETWQREGTEFQKLAAKNREGASSAASALRRPALNFGTNAPRRRPVQTHNVEFINRILRRVERPPLLFIYR